MIRTIKCLASIFFMLGVISTQPAAAQDADAAWSPSMPAPLTYEEHRLDNGLTIITHEDHSTPIVNTQLWYHVGSKNEVEGRTGFAHLFEHLMFQGSENVAPEEHSALINGVGGVMNAYTSDDVTVYWETVPSNYLERVLWLEADRMRSLEVSEENFSSEREVVKEERRVRVESPPYGDLFETLYATAFDVHPYSHTPIGSMEDLDNATIDDIRGFFETYYAPSNAYLVLAGDFNTELAMTWIEEYFGSIPSGQNPVPRVTVREPAHDAERRVAREKAVPLPAYVAGYYVPEDGHPDSYPLVIASSILAEGRSSRVYTSLVYESQLALQADSGASFREHPNLFFAILIMNQGASIEDGEALLNAEFQRMMEEPVTEEELEKARNQMRSSYIMGRQSVEDKAGALGHAAVIHQDTASANDELGLFLDVSAEDIMRVTRQYLNPENRTVLTVAPSGG
jgi:zinc protease